MFSHKELTEGNEQHMTLLMLIQSELNAALSGPVREPSVRVAVEGVGRAMEAVGQGVQTSTNLYRDWTQWTGQACWCDRC
uniref:Uncharacterized protein n=1 Tax=Knipowitschia caucasica TaxID=637954 RepID=A0AAV2LKL1_KNICA